MLVELDRFFQAGQPPPQVRLVRHLALVLHDLVSGLRHNVLNLSGWGKKNKNIQLQGGGWGEIIHTHVWVCDSQHEKNISFGGNMQSISNTHK